MELTRLRRFLRESTTVSSYADMQALLDMIDSVYEEAQDYKDHMQGGVHPDESFIGRTVTEQAKSLVIGLANLEAMGVYGVLSALIEAYGYNVVSSAFEDCKKAQEAMIDLENPFADLEDHPF